MRGARRFPHGETERCSGRLRGAVVMRDAEATMSDLRRRPDFLPVVADRIWRAWWRDEGVSLAGMEALVGEALSPAPLPLVFVAHRDDRFFGTASIIADDLKARPQYSPWLAAVFVEPEARGAGIASALVRTATKAAFQLPIERLYLNATPATSPLYASLGWSLLETDVGGLNVFSTTRGRATEGPCDPSG